MRPSTLLRLLFALAVTLFLLWKSHPADVVSVLSRVSWAPIAGACALVVIDRALMAYRWLALLAPLGGRRPPVPAIMRVFFVSTFLGTFLPASVGSDAVRVWSLSRQGVPAAETLASVLMDRLLGTVSILVSAAAGLVILPALLRDPTVGWAFAVMAAGCAAALAFVFSGTVDDLTRRMLTPWRASRLRQACLRTLDALQAYRTEHRMVAGVLAASVGVQVLRILQAWLLGLSLGVAAPLSGYFALIPIILLVMLLPFTINGLGTSQLAFVWSFAWIGVGRPEAFALSLLFLALGIVGNLPGGLLYVFDTRERGAARHP